MNVELTADITPDDLVLLESIYERSFPEEERRPWPSIVNPANPASPQLFSIVADGHLAGMLTVWKFDRFAYIEHLAIDPALRAKGVGSAAMRQIMEKLGNVSVVVEIEPPSPAMPDTLRRQKFYTDLGFVTIATDYVQPPYSPALPSVPMHLLATSTLPPVSTAATLHSRVYGHHS